MSDSRMERILQRKTSELQLARVRPGKQNDVLPHMMAMHRAMKNTKPEVHWFMGNARKPHSVSVKSRQMGRGVVELNFVTDIEGFEIITTMTNNRALNTMTTVKRGEEMRLVGAANHNAVWQTVADLNVLGLSESVNEVILAQQIFVSFAHTQGVGYYMPRELKKLLSAGIIKGAVRGQRKNKMTKADHTDIKPWGQQ